MQHTHYLTWVTIGQIGSAIATPISDGISAHTERVASAVAEFPGSHVGNTYKATEYADLPDDMVDAALNGDDPDLERLGHEMNSGTWYGRRA